MARRGRGDGSIRRRKDGSWEGRLRYVDPVTELAERLSFYGRERADVVEQLDAARARLRRRRTPRDEGLRLGEFLDLWLEDVVKPTKTARTYRNYGSIIDQILKRSQLAGVQLRDLSGVQIQHVLVAKVKKPTRMTQLALVVLRRALAQAVQWEMRETNPAIGITPPRRAKRQLRALTKAEARRFLKAARSDQHFALYYLAIDTGMRQGELFGLHWRDVDLERGILRVVRTVDTSTGEEGEPKTASSRRRVELGMAARKALAAHRAFLEARGYSGALVFPNAAGRPLSPSNLRRNSFLPLQLVAKIHPPVRFHDLRHTAATLMLEDGVHPKVVSERLGHASIAVTMDFYQHVSSTMQRSAARRMDAILSIDQTARSSNGGKVGGGTGRNGRVRK